MANVVIYTTRYCPYCIAAKRLLESLGQQYKEIAVDNDTAMRKKLVNMSGQRTVPQIWIDDAHVGGYSDMAHLHTQGKLLPMLHRHG